MRTAVREKVEAVIAELVTFPIRRLERVSNKSGLIGLVMLTEADELFGDPYSALVSGIQDGCRENNIVLNLPGSGVRKAAPINSSSRSPVASSTESSSPQVPVVKGSSTLRARGSRLVVVGHPEDDDNLRIDVDNYGGTRLAVDHLVGLGRQRIAYVVRTTTLSLVSSASKVSCLPLLAG